MEEQVCTKCNIAKKLSDFHKDSHTNNGYTKRCKICKLQDTKEQRTNKKVTIKYEKVDSKKCSKCNDKLAASMFNKNCLSKDGLTSVCKKCYSHIRKNRKIVSETFDYKTDLTTKKCRLCNITKNINMFRKNRKSSDNYTHICIDCLPKNNWTPEKQSASHKKYSNKPNIKLYRTLRNSQNKRIRCALQKDDIIKSKHTIEYLGCSIELLKLWFEYQFKNTLFTWDNYGLWEIDHVTPCKCFDFTKEEDTKRCFNWMNLQPLLKSENIKKKDKLISEIIKKHKKKVEEFRQSFSAQVKEGELLELPLNQDTTIKLLITL